MNVDYGQVASERNVVEVLHHFLGRNVKEMITLLIEALKHVMHFMVLHISVTMPWTFAFPISFLCDHDHYEIDNNGKSFAMYFHKGYKIVLILFQDILCEEVSSKYAKRPAVK